jgi:subtilisin family serine protease
MIDGRIKPDITAPGLTIATSVSSYDTTYIATGSNKSLTKSSYLDPVLNKRFYYSEFTGTSASAPAASGIVALLLQAKPTLGPKEVNDIIALTAIKDAQTGAIPAAGNNNWGHGKINAYGAMKSFFNNTGIYSYTGEKLECELFPNPSDGLFTIRYDSNKNHDLNFEIFNMIGDLVQSDSWKTVSGSNLRPVDLSGMPGGVYLLRLSSSEGFVSIKTIKQ